MNKDKFTFKYEGQDGKVMEMQFLEDGDQIEWPELQDRFNEFLRGLGYYIEEK